MIMNSDKSHINTVKAIQLPYTHRQISIDTMSKKSSLIYENCILLLDAKLLRQHFLMMSAATASCQL